ncbi:MAG: Mur ligase domain-containing protein [Acidobacteria bacterium]|nr:Mur ligase domain-containing protein [Acidobacteriota bacterium]
MQNLYERAERLYFLPIGGTAMAPLAGMLHEAGHHVEGVDSELYPPMSTLLAELGIPVRLGFDPEKMPTDIDRVIIGNAIPRHNPEATAVLEQRIPHLSQAEAVAHYVLARGLDSIVVAGTHGKTTTSAMVAWILERAGVDPSYLIGGLPRWNQRGFRLGGGRHLVIEGDEYNSAFFDRGAKFLHYRPRIFLIGPVEFDHADLYPDLDGILTAFRAGAALVPRDGSVIVNAWREEAVTAARDATAHIILVGPHPDCPLQLASWQPEGDRSTAIIRWRGEEHLLELSHAGLHNLQNAAMAVAAAVSAGIGIATAVTCIKSFPGVARRMDVVGEAAGVIVVDDFAHHPTALGVTVAAARQRWPNRRLVVAFEPRSLTAARRSFHDAYVANLAGADLVMVAPPYHRNRLEATDVLDRCDLARALEERGVTALMPNEEDDVVDQLLGVLQPGDVVIGCSSGAFGGMHRKLIEALQSGDER